MNFKSSILPHAIAVVIFLLLNTIFFNPILFKNMGLAQQDVLQGAGANQEIIDYRAETGEEALWTNSMFSGMPAYLINLRWSGDLLRYMAKIYSLWFPSPMDVTFIAMLSFYILLLVFGVRPYLAIAGAIAFSLGSFNIISIDVGHIWKARAIAYMPLVLAGVHLTFSRKLLGGFILTAIALALEIHSNHLQITYYLFLLLLIYGMVSGVYMLKEKQGPDLLKIAGVLAAAGILAIACNLGKVWTVYEYGKYSIRGGSELTAEPGENTSGLDKSYAFHWSNGIMEPITLLIPNYFGGPSQQSLSNDSNLAQALSANGLAPVQVRDQLRNVPTYWGDQPGVAGPYYIGAISCFLLVLALTVVEKRHVYWLVIAAVISIMLSWGKNFETLNYLIFDYLPGYNKFRSVTIVIVIALVCIPLLGFMGLEKLLSTGLNEVTRKKFFLSGAITIGLLLLVITFAGLNSFRGAADGTTLSQFPSWYMDALRADRQALLRSDAIRSLIFVALLWGAVYFYLKKSLSMQLALSLIVMLTAADVWFVSKRFIGTEDFVSKPIQNFGAVNAADQLILEDPELSYRVLNLQNPWNEVRTSYNHQSLGGYHGAKIQRYQDLIENCLTSEIQGFISGLQNRNVDLSNLRIASMLNTKYLLAGNTRESVINNPQHWGNAWFASQIKAVGSPDEEIASICEIDNSQTAVVNTTKWDIQKNHYGSDGSIELLESTPNYLKYESENAEEGFAVFSEIFYPKGWQAFIDGEETTIIQANYLLRAIEVPPGKHAIEFKFLPDAYYIGNKIMLAASSLLILVSLYGLFRISKKTLDQRAAATSEL